MLDFRPLATIAGTEPGGGHESRPVLAVSPSAAGSTRRSALLTAAGTTSASVIWASATLLGLRVILTKAADIYHLLRFVGGLYLCFIGFSIWRGASAPLPPVKPEGVEHNAYRRALLLVFAIPTSWSFWAPFSPLRSTHRLPRDFQVGRATGRAGSRDHLVHHLTTLFRCE